MAFTYDLTTAIGKVRLRIPDKDSQAPLFDDAEIQAFLDANGADVLLATAEAIETIAGDPQRLQEFQRGAIRKTPQLAFNLRERARQLRDQAMGGITIGSIERGEFYGSE